MTYSNIQKCPFKHYQLFNEKEVDITFVFPRDSCGKNIYLSCRLREKSTDIDLNEAFILPN